MIKETPDVQEVGDSLTAAQLKKLNLEIEHLQSTSRFERRLASYIPLLTVSIAVAGFLFGIYQVIAEQQKDRLARDREQAIRIQNQIRSNLDQIVQFLGDKPQTISKLSFLLEDLKSYLELNADTSQSPQANKRSISVTLATSVTYDSNFDQHRDVVYASTLLDRWEDYGSYLREHNGQIEYILSKYLQALSNIYRKDSSVLRGIRFRPEVNEFEYREGFGKLNVDQLYHFQDIVIGFRMYRNLINDETIKQKYSRRFQAAICNGALTQQYFGVKFNPHDYPDELPSDCR